MNDYFIHDASANTLVIVSIKDDGRDTEEQVYDKAKELGLSWSDCSWGGADNVLDLRVC